MSTLKIISKPPIVAKKKSDLKGGVLTIGNFDGVHLGHQHLIDSALKLARSLKAPLLLYTFYPHPAQVLFPQKKHLLLCPFKKNKELLLNTPINGLIVQNFTKAFAQLSPEHFLEQHIIAPFKPKGLVVGPDFRFGCNKTGKTGFLKNSGKNNNFKVKIVKPLKKQGLIISTSLIKKTIFKGDWALVPVLLGRAFSITGQVVKGEGRGKALGFPTINIEADKHIILPVNGVYTGQIKEKHKCFQAVINIGTNPTFSTNRLKKIEAHVLGTALPKPQKTCELEIFTYLRPEKKFSNAKNLVSQIKKDINQALALFSSPSFFS